jgi:hypothetical protein
VRDPVAGREPRRIRWYGDPAEHEQPDVGDVLTYTDPVGHRPDWYHLVHDSAPVRGRDVHDLWLMVTRHDFGPDASIPEPIWQAYDAGSRFFRAHRMRRR